MILTKRYGIRYETPEVNIRRKYGKVLNPFSVDEVSQEVAEMDSEKGVYALFNEHGQKISAWVYITNLELEESVRKAKLGTPLPDRMGTMLKAGDYVLTTINSSHNLCLARVVGFTPDYVRIEDIQRNGSYLTTKKSEHLVKISDKLPEE